MPGGKAVPEQLKQIDLTARLGQHIKILIMNMDIPIDMRCRYILGKDIVVHKIIGAFRTVFQHGSHGGIGINICIFPLDIRFRRTGKSKFLIDLHQIRFCLADLRMLCTVQNIGLGSLCKTVFDQLFLHKILDLFHIRRFSLRNRLHHCFYQLLKLVRSDRLHSRCIIGFSDGIPDLFYIKWRGHPVPLPDYLRTYNSVPTHPYSSMKIPCLPFFASLHPGKPLLPAPAGDNYIIFLLCTKYSITNEAKMQEHFSHSVPTSSLQRNPYTLLHRSHWRL